MHGQDLRQSAAAGGDSVQMIRDSHTAAACTCQLALQWRLAICCIAGLSAAWPCRGTAEVAVVQQTLWCLPTF